ncbi:nicotinate-nucleotide adenylyltransferase [Powellomyces hirtus]|uniref:Nicotinate-nucleotide adenylyltransferase n=1 Tax=Powellomyces hirtus TaxID=109895 RepID=A0A507ED88_9FUNG|nr:nicotinate-nucleotide adenylyltransferase [Powellomyces hirtus]
MSTHAHSIAAVAKALPRSTAFYPADYVFPRGKLAEVVGLGKRQPVVAVACGSYSPVTNLHLRMFEMARDYISDHPNLHLIGGYFSPVSDAYNKPGLVSWPHRVAMCEEATKDSDWIMVDSWESRQKEYQRTAWVLDHFNEMLNGNGQAGN